ncbi:MAG: DUF1553 domain-containing protein [Planctomycetia bacterium]|nr:DUF1553 domain-containing protein [Planctomycetia bacterium]
MTAPDNPYFARATDNRTWAQFFGRALVNPVDNINDTGEASHPKLFEALARRFASDGFDLEHLIRGLCNSRVYQPTSVANPGHVRGRFPLRPDGGQASRPNSSTTRWSACSGPRRSQDRPQGGEARRELAA